MGGRRDLLERIASALERLAPPLAPQSDWMAADAYSWDGSGARPISALDALPLEILRGIDRQKQAVVANLEHLAKGFAAHDMLLWGARGMGKSALVRSVVSDVNSRHPGSLALVQIATHEFAALPELIEQLAGEDRAFLLFLDDLGFGERDTQSNLTLRSLLDGGILARPANVRLAVTSNRRAIVARDADAEHALHERDERDNALALADRFGLTLGFHPCDRETYLEILRAYTDPLDLTFVEEEALAWAIARGNRSGRTALQYATELAGRAGKAF